MARITSVKLADLVEDFSIYPRHAIDGSWSAELARAIEADEPLPPPVVDRASKRIVDGWHRVRAWRKILGRGGSIDVELRDYANEQELLKDAIRLNAAHGRKLDQQDRSRSALLLERAGITVKEISVVLHTTEPRVQELLTRVVVVQGQPQPAKPIAYPTEGAPRTMTPEQYEVMHGSMGWRPSQVITQLSREIEAGVLDLKDAVLTAKLWALHDLIAAKVPRAG